MGRLWAQPRVTFDGRYRMFNGPGINPPAAIGCTSICFGSHADVILDASRPLGQRQKPLAKFGRLRSFTKEKSATIRPRQALPSFILESAEFSVIFWQPVTFAHVCESTARRAGRVR